MSIPQAIAAAILMSVPAAVLVGCGSHVVPSSGPRPATDPQKVSIYQKEPKKYEVLGVVEVPVGGDVRWDERGDASPGFDKLKSGAAARGGNGILLIDPARNDPEKNPMLVTAGYHGTFYQVPVRKGTPSVAVVQAVYVHSE